MSGWFTAVRDVWLNGVKLASSDAIEFLTGFSVVRNPTTGRLEVTNTGGGGGGAGDVVGPASSVVDRLALYADATGKLLKQASFGIADLVKINGSAAFTGNQSLGGNKITGSGNASSAGDLTPLSQVQALIAAGVSPALLDWKESVVVATTANITLSGEQTIDGVLTSASRVLVKDHATGASKGIYVTAAGAWTRATDFDASAEVTTGATVFVEQGTINGGKFFFLATTGAIVLGTTALTFVALSGLPTASAVGQTIIWNGTAYVAGSLEIASVVACATANVALTGAYTADGITLVNGDRYLAAFQTNPNQNGVYIYASGGAHARATDFDAVADFRPGVWFTITSGERYGGGLATVQQPPTTIGSTPIAFTIAEPTPQDSTLSHPSADTVGSREVIRKSSGTEASPTAHLSAAVLGERLWQGHDGTAYYDAFGFRVVAEAAGGTSKRVRFESQIHNGTSLATGERAVQALGATTNATQTTVYSVLVAADEIVSLAIRWVGKQAGSSNRAIRETNLVVRRSGSGNVVEVSHADGTSIFKDDSAWGDSTQISYTLNNTTHAVDIHVQGKAATNIDWVVDVVWATR